MWELKFRATAEKWTEIEFVLAQFDVLAVTQSSGDIELFDRPNSPDKNSWEFFSVVALFEKLSNTDGACGLLKTIVDSPSTLEKKELSDQIDWAVEWRKYWKFKVLKSGLCICPNWLSPPQGIKKLIRLDPGRAFGTGTHDTTNLCLEFLEEFSSLKDYKLVDYGCGSGILALAAVAFGCRNVVATDVDVDALEIAQSNVQLNGFHKEVSVVEPGSLRGQVADIVLANIMLDVLIDLRDVLLGLTSKRGYLVLSGITTSQIIELTSVYDKEFFDLSIKERNGWGILVLGPTCQS